MKKVSNTPYLPNAGRVYANFDAANKFDQDLTKSLRDLFIEFSTRLNEVLPKDGSEPMVGDLDLGGFNIINGGGGGSQPLNGNLTALSGLTGAADQLPYFTGPSAMALTTLTAFARTLIDDTTAGAARTTLGIGSASTTAEGLIEIATNAEAQAGTDTTRALTPDDLVAAKIQQTSQVTTSGTSQTITGIPTWAKKVTITWEGVSTNGSSQMVVRLGTSGGIETTTYLAGAASFGGTGTGTITTGIPMTGATVGAAVLTTGSVLLTKQSGNTWTGPGSYVTTGTATIGNISASKALSGVLDRVQVTTLGADTLDAGAFTVSWE